MRACAFAWGRGVAWLGRMRVRGWIGYIDWGWVGVEVRREDLQVRVAGRRFLSSMSQHASPWLSRRPLMLAHILRFSLSLSAL